MGTYPWSSRWLAGEAMAAAQHVIRCADSGPDGVVREAYQELCNWLRRDHTLAKRRERETAYQHFFGRGAG
ncbi:hypothetical protein MYX77_01095 [Acidobacteriia bacterium AH_259_A11_L15]|nr:hypothetical protein [Acidobacteriia bacterium AH_259_A11_L15]